MKPFCFLEICYVMQWCCIELSNVNSYMQWHGDCFRKQSEHLQEHFFLSKRKGAHTLISEDYNIIVVDYSS